MKIEKKLKSDITTMPILQKLYNIPMNLKRNGYVITDIDSRKKKAEKIFTILSDCTSLTKKRILDIGSGTGIIGFKFAKNDNDVISVDITDKHFNDVERTINFQVADAQNLPYKTGTFDIVICNHILEHVVDKREVISEIKRVLKIGGFCYVANDNKLWPIEPHYKLPFLSYLPYSLANEYIKIFKGKGNYDISLPTFWEFQELIGGFKNITNFTISVIREPEKYHAEDVVSHSDMIRMIPNFILKILVPYLPGWIYVVEK